MKRSIWFNFIERSRLTYLMLFGIFLVGMFSTGNINIESNPEINQPLGIVQTFYPNASAIDVEKNVTEVLEKEFQGLANLKKITSTSRNNLSSITVEFETSADSDEVIADLEEATNKAARRLPDQAEDPEVIELDFNGMSIVSLSVVGDADFKELTELGEDIADEINTISGVSRVDIIGGYNEELTIVLDNLVAEFYGISAGQIVQTIQSGNLNLPIGEVRKAEDSINVRVKGELNTVEAIKSLPLVNLSGGSTNFQILTIGDVADVSIEPTEQDTLSFVSDGNSKAKRAVTLNVYKSKGGNIVNIVNSVDEKVEEVKQGLGDGFDIVKTNDNAFFIKNDLSTLSSSGLQTIAVIFVAILLVLSVKEALVASIAIPLIFLITFATLYWSGETLNGLTIFSLILSLGLIVDTSIVIVEGIYEFKKEGKDSITAAKETLSQYMWPLVAGTLTTLSAFAPMLLVSGIVGEYIRTIPIVLSITLAASLLVSFSITPLLSVQLINLFDRFEKNKAKKSLSFKEKLFEQIKDLYESTLTTVLNSRLIRVVILLVAGIAFVASMALPISGLLKAQLFPEADTPFVYVNFEAAVGTSLDNTREMAEVIEEKLLEKDYIKNYTLNFGNKISTDQSGISSGNQDNLGHVVVNLLDDEALRPKSYVISSELRKEFEQIETPLDISVESVSAGPPTAAPLEIRLTGSELEQLKSISEDIKNVLEGIDGLVNISSDFDEDNVELELTLDEDKISYYGLNKQLVAQNLQSLVNGIEATEIQFEGDTLKVRVWQGSIDKKDYSELANTLIPTSVGYIPLSEIGYFTENRSLQVIPRIDLERSVRVRGFTDEGVVIADLLPMIEEEVGKLDLPTGYVVSFGGEDEDIQQSFTELFSSMIVAVILILIVLVTQFNSFRQTLIILCTLPLAAIGIFPGLTLMGLPLSFPAFLGVVMLTGIVVNDAIVMVDQINRNRFEEGMELKEAIINACRLRFVPIMLTTITTIFGLLPITIADEFWKGLGFSVIFGLSTATFLTLIIIPVLFTIFLKEKKKTKKLKASDDNNTNQFNLTES